MDWTPSDVKPTPGTPPDQLKRYQTATWFATQLTLSLGIGVSSFVAFCVMRRRSPLLFAPRTLLKGFSPHEVHASDGFLSWIIPTLRTSEYAVLQIVGLDASVLLNFFKLGFVYFFSASIFALFFMLPVNMRDHGTTEGVPPDPPSNKTSSPNVTSVHDSLGQEIFHGTTVYLASQLCFVYVLSIQALFLLRRTYVRFTTIRQLAALDLAHSVPARTVYITRLPPHLRTEPALASFYNDTCKLPVDSVSVVRHVNDLAMLLQKRTAALLQLEQAWHSYVGNPVDPSRAREFDPEMEVQRILDGAGGAVDGDRRYEARGLRRAEPESQIAHSAEEAELGATQVAVQIQEDHQDSTDEHSQLIPSPNPVFSHPRKKRPTLRRSWNPCSSLFTNVDALEHFAEQFRIADMAVRRRRHGRFRPADEAFVTFENLGTAQLAAQCVVWPSVGGVEATLAPEPRDIMWCNIALAPWVVTSRRLLSVMLLVLVLLFWTIPVGFLATLLSYKLIKQRAPWLAIVIARNKTIETLVQTSLPSLAVISWNALLPFLLEWLCVLEGLQARTWIETSLLGKYHIGLVLNVIFVFVTVSTAALFEDIRKGPENFIDKLARSLPGARNFFIAYVMLQGLAIMPLQLLQLPVIITRLFYRMFVTRTPRQFTELNTPPVLNLGSVYPQAILVFNICMLFSVVAPLILVFGAIYFGVAYLVYKYKLLFIYYRPFESKGQAWPVTCNRIGWGMILFQIFHVGLFSLRGSILLTLLVLPLLATTVYYLRRLDQGYKGHSRFVNLSQACEAEVGESGEVMKLKRGHPVTPSQTNLNVRRYGHQDTSLYIVAEDAHTDYSQPPMSDVFLGVLDTGRKRYAHPGIYGQMPEPQLPILKTVKPTGPNMSLGFIIDFRQRLSKSTRHLNRKPVSTKKKQPTSNTTSRKQVSRQASATKRDDQLERGNNEASPTSDDGGRSAEEAEDDDLVLTDDEQEGTFFQRPQRRRSRQSPSGYERDDDDNEEEDSDQEQTPTPPFQQKQTSKKID